MQNLSASAPSQADEKENKEINLVSPASRGTAQASPGGNGEPTIRFLMVKMLAIATMAILFMIVVVLLSQFVDRLYSSSEQAVAAESALESFSILCL